MLLLKHIFVWYNSKFFIYSLAIGKEPCYCSVAKSYPTLCDLMGSSMPGSSVLCSLPEFAKFMSIELVMPSNHLILCQHFA